MKVFLLEDDRDTVTYIVRGLSELGHVVETCADGMLAVGIILAKRFDVVVLDRMVPGLDGLSVLKAVRAAGCNIPALVLTARARIDDRVDGFDAGADDYLVKPYAFVELVARINALARRPPPIEVVTFLRCGDVEMDLLRRTVRRADREIDLPPREFTLLEYLMRNCGKAVTKTMLLEQVWDMSFDPHTNVVETQISRLRAKLDQYGGEGVIRTVRGVGYMMVDDAV